MTTTTEFNTIAAMTVREMSQETREAFLAADDQTRADLAIAFAQAAVEKFDRISTKLTANPQALAEMTGLVYDNATA